MGVVKQLADEIRGTIEEHDQYPGSLKVSDRLARLAYGAACLMENLEEQLHERRHPAYIVGPSSILPADISPPPATPEFREVECSKADPANTVFHCSLDAGHAGDHRYDSLVLAGERRR